MKTSDRSPTGRVQAARLGLALGLALLVMVVIWLCPGTGAAADPLPVSIGLVTDENTLDDMAYNWLAYQGLLRAEQQLGVAGTVYTSTSSADYEPNLQQCADDGNALCISVGLLMAEATWNKAQANPGTHFVILDTFWPETPDNLRGATFASDEAGYLAGTLAGLMTESDVIGDIGGMPIPSVDAFVYGYRNGARCANPEVSVLMTYTWSFDNPDQGAQVAQALIGQGADVIFAPAGGTGSGAILAAAQSGAWAIGVDVDQYLTVVEGGNVPGADRLLSSALKRLDTAAYDTIADEVAGAFSPGTVLYDLAADGVGLAPFHEADPAIPHPVKDALAQVRQGIIDGTVDVNDPCWTYTRHVDAAGSDTGDCTDPNAPCRTVGYALSQSVADDAILVAGGTFVENLYVPHRVTLEGGYSGPPDWMRDRGQYETVLDGSASQTLPGDWDEAIRYPTLVYDAGTYELWYNGSDLYGKGRVGYATSPDGVNWTKHGAPVLEAGAEGEWDSYGVGEGYVLKEGPASYKMWFSGYGPGSCAIGYATSTNGIDWVKYPGNPVLSPGEDGWNNLCVQHPSVLREDGVYKMWLLTAGDEGSGSVPYFAFATSLDGLTWTWDAANPIFARDWEGWIWRPDVLHLDGTYLMWYSLWAEGEAHISLAWSTDGIAWTKHGSPVLSGGFEEWDSGFVADPAVLFDGDAYTLYYDNVKAIGLATSEDGIEWTKPFSTPVLFPGEATQYGAPVVEFAPQAGGSVLDGFRVTGGDARGAGGVQAGEAGITIRNCTIHNNRSYGDGAGGGVAGRGGLIVEDSLIIDNQLVSGNEPGATGGAGGVRTAGPLSMVNTVVARNLGDAGIHANGDVWLTNVTVTANDGDLIFNPQPAGTLSILNSILYGNARVFLWGCPGGSTCSVTYSDLESGWPDTGNINADPLFVGAGDYHLQGISPCVNAGTPEGAPPRDLEGTPRGPRPDMGAYEWGRFRVYLPVVLR